MKHASKPSHESARHVVEKTPSAPCRRGEAPPAQRVAIAASARMTAQRQQLEAAFGATAQRPQASSGAPVTQRWAPLSGGGKIQWSQTDQIRTLTSGQPVFFFDDFGGDTIVVKGEDTPIGMANLVAAVHAEISGTPTVFTRQLDNADRINVTYLIAAPGHTTHASWAALGQTHLVQNNHWPGATPADQARHHHQQQLLGLPKLHAMELAPGETARKLATPQGAGPALPMTARTMFINEAYLQNIGVITATDLFLENADRVYVNNFGNWTTQANLAITLIDNLDNDAKNMWRRLAPAPTGADLVNELADGQIAVTAQTVVNQIRMGLVNAGDATAPAWLLQLMGAGTRADFMKLHIEAGLRDGKARIILKYASRKGGLAGRGRKQEASRQQGIDTTAGDVPVVDYWDMLKTRARYLAGI